MPLLRLAPGTAEWMHRALDVLERRLGGYSVTGRFRHHVATLHRDLAESPAQKAAYVLGRLLRYAQTIGVRSEPHDLAGVCSIKTRQRKRVITLPERARLIPALQADCSPRARVVSDVLLLLIYSGWRSSEAASLEWQCVDLISGDCYLERTKAGPQTRTLGPEALAIVAARAGAGRHPIYVFPNRRGDGPVAHPDVLKRFRAVCRELGLVGACVHSLRATFCTVAAQLSIHPSVIASAVGHTTQWQQATYTHPNPDDVRAAASAVAEAMRRVDR